MPKFALLLVICLLLCSCSQGQEKTFETETESVISETTSETSSESSAEAAENHTAPVIVETETTTETESSGECHCEYDWQHAYAEYINQRDFYQGLYIDDINGDDIPEAVIDINTLGSTIVLYYTENGMAELRLETVSSWGSVSYLADTKQILYCPFHGHTWATFGNEEYCLIDWNGTEYTVSSSMYRESGLYVNTEDRHIEEYGQAYINGEEVDNDTFEIKLAEFRELEQNNGYFPAVNIQDENFESYVKEKLPDFKMPESNY